MAVRVRSDGSIVCAAMHERLPDDRAYLDDELHYRLSVEYGVLVTDDQHLPKEGRTGHGLWWWHDAVPSERTPLPFYAKARAQLGERGEA